MYLRSLFRTTTIVFTRRCIPFACMYTHTSIGAGKSTVLHAWAGKIKYSSKLTLEGNRYMNGVPLSSDSTVPAAFIEQDVQFFPHMTVRETLNFRVELKLGALLSKTARDEMVDDLMSQLGLTKTANTVVGDSKVRGISGGERKRLSIAVEMISSPSVLYVYSQYSIALLLFGNVAKIN